MRWLIKGTETEDGMVWRVYIKTPYTYIGKHYSEKEAMDFICEESGEEPKVIRELTLICYD